MLHVAQGDLKDGVEEIEKSGVGVKHAPTISDTEEEGCMKCNQIELHISSKPACPYMKQW